MAERACAEEGLGTQSLVAEVGGQSDRGVLGDVAAGVSGVIEKRTTQANSPEVRIGRMPGLEA